MIEKIYCGYGNNKPPIFDGLYHPFMVMTGAWFMIAIPTLDQNIEKPRNGLFVTILNSRIGMYIISLSPHVQLVYQHRDHFLD